MSDFSFDGGDGFEPEVEITETGACSRTLKITIPAAEIDNRLELQLGNLANEASIPGFRKGRVPRAILEKRFGENVRHETRGQVVSDAFQQALKSNEIDIIGDPDFGDPESVPMVEPGTDFVFTVSIEVVPAFDLPDLEGVPVTKPIMEVTDEMIDAEVVRNRYRFGSPARITGPFESLDRMVGEVVVKVEGNDEPFFEHEKAVAVVPAEEDEGKGQFLGLLVEDLAEQLGGKNVGDVVEFDTVGPESFEREEIRGKKVSIRFDIKDAERVTPLEVAELLERFGLDDESGLKEQLRLALENRRDSEQRSAEREQVYEWLLDNISFDVPPKVSEAQAANLVEQQRMDLLGRGLDENEVEMKLAEMRSESERYSKDRLRLMFIMARVAKHFDVNVGEAEVNGRIAEIAAAQQARPEEVRSELAKSGRIREVAMSIQQAKAADRVVDTAKVTEMPADEWNEVVEKRVADRKKAAGK
ncbi:MAG: trigger factor [Phycisphaera sp.]|nr:trigger factor [Phycisphaera sp.]